MIQLCPTFVTSWTAARQAFLSFTDSQNLLKLRPIESVVPSKHLILYLPHLLLFSQHQGLFHWVNLSHQVAKELELQLQHQSFQWIFRVDFLSDSLLWSPCCPRHSQESSPTPQFKSKILWCSAFFIVQLSHPYMKPGKIIALTRLNSVAKVMPPLFNMPSSSSSSLVIAILPRSIF